MASTLDLPLLQAQSSFVNGAAADRGGNDFRPRTHLAGTYDCIPAVHNSILIDGEVEDSGMA